MKTFLLGLAVILLGRSAQAAEVSSAARERARSYQENAKAVLIEHGWRVSREAGGTLVANHPLGAVATLGGGSKRMGLTDTDPDRLNLFPFTMYAQLVLSFVPNSATRTVCSANIVVYYYDRSYGGKLSKAHPFNNPDSTKKIQGMIAEAEKRLSAQHPEYAAQRDDH